MEIQIKRCMGGDKLMDAAQILASCQSNSYPSPREAYVELEKLAYALVSAVFVAMVDSQVVGVVAGAPAYHGHVCELRLIAVAKSARHQGVGTALVAALEGFARQSGMKTLWLGSSDENSAALTSIDPYADIHTALNVLKQNTETADFYSKLGYAMVGILPDANGPSQPHLFFSKRL